jgi:cytochrome c-type biogenesis protein CcmE
MKKIIIFLLMLLVSLVCGLQLTGQQAACSYFLSPQNILLNTVATSQSSSPYLGGVASKAVDGGDKLCIWAFTDSYNTVTHTN